MATTNVSDSDLKKLREANEKKREQLRAATAEKWGTVADDNRALLAAQLEAENTRLDAEIAAAKQVKKNRKSALTPLDQALEDQKNAEAALEAQKEASAAQPATDAATAAENDKENK